jgi:hypothetical protein
MAENEKDSRSKESYFKYIPERDAYVEMVYDQTTGKFTETTSILTVEKVRKAKRNVLQEPLRESQIKQAQRISKSAAEAAKNLKVSYATYKKYAKMYGIFEDLINQHGNGISKGGMGRILKTPLQDIFDGKKPNYSKQKLKRRLISEGVKEEKCENCGFCEHRLIDYKVPLLLDFIDGNNKNLSYENLRFLCYNCSYLLNGNLT